MSSSNDSEQHHLYSFLSQKLPELGLDYETYAPYILGISDDSSDNGAATVVVMDEEELDGVMELLQASSETHSDDAEAWMQLKRDIVEKQEQYQRAIEEAAVKQRQAAHEAEQERLQQDIQLAQQHPVEPKKKTTREMDEQKRALMERFGYEEPNDEHVEGGDGIVEATTTLVSNKNVKEAHSTQKTTKKQEQEATKQAKLAKMKLKEERRKRATKSERRR